MDTIEYVLTPEQFAKTEQELAELSGPRREEIKQAIIEARGFGDLSENAEYDAARDAQARNEARIKDLEQIIANARIVEATDANSVSIGSSVEIEDERGKRRTFRIVGTTQTNSLNGDISNESPAGMALMGHVVGDRVSFATPSGKVREYLITSIEV